MLFFQQGTSRDPADYTEEIRNRDVPSVCRFVPLRESLSSGSADRFTSNNSFYQTPYVPGETATNDYSSVNIYANSENDHEEEYFSEIPARISDSDANEEPRVSDIRIGDVRNFDYNFECNTGSARMGRKYERTEKEGIRRWQNEIPRISIDPKDSKIVFNWSDKYLYPTNALSGTSSCSKTDKSSKDTNKNSTGSSQLTVSAYLSSSFENRKTESPFSSPTKPNNTSQKKYYEALSLTNSAKTSTRSFNLKRINRPLSTSSKKSHENAKPRSKKTSRSSSVSRKLPGFHPIPYHPPVYTVPPYLSPPEHTRMPLYPPMPTNYASLQFTPYMQRKPMGSAWQPSSYTGPYKVLPQQFYQYIPVSYPTRFQINDLIYMYSLFYYVILTFDVYF